MTRLVATASASSRIPSSCLPGLLDEAVQKHHHVAFHREQHPRDPARDMRPDFPKPRLELADERHPYRPAELCRLDVETDQSILDRQEYQSQDSSTVTLVRENQHAVAGKSNPRQERRR